MKIVITGASRGIGRAGALALAAEADNEVLAIARSSEALTKLQSDAPHQNITGITLDLEHSAYPKLEVQLERWGHLDILINNAGLLINKPFARLTDADWQRLFAINTLAPARLTRLCLPYLCKSDRAHIINISSMGGFQGSGKYPGLSAYSSSKAALASLTECLAEELKDDNVRCNCLALGAVQTEMLAAAFPGYEAPLNSVEMGNFLHWFAVEGRSFFNGKILPVSVSSP